MQYQYTVYFENEVLRKRPYLKKEWCIAVVENPLRVEMQDDNRYRFWGKISLTSDKFLRVVTLKTRERYTMPFLTGGLSYEN